MRWTFLLEIKDVSFKGMHIQRDLLTRFVKYKSLPIHASLVPKRGEASTHLPQQVASHWHHRSVVFSDIKIQNKVLILLV